MGFWDFIAPDFEGFKEAVAPYTPAVVLLGDVGIDRDQLLTLAYLAPASAAGLAARLIYQNGSVQAGSQSGSSSLVQAQLDNLCRGGTRPIGANAVGTDLTQGVNVATIVVANTYECTVRATVGGRAVDNVFHFTGSGPGQEPAACTAFQAAWKVASGPLSRFDSRYTLVSFTAVDLSSITGGIFTIADTTAGARTSVSIATRAACALVQYNGQTRSRNSRGRTYFGPLYTADVGTDGASMVGTSQTAVGTAFTNFRSTMTTAGFTQCVLSRALAQTFPVTFVRVQPTIATQRNRLRG